jgi:hypothetical protein
MEIKKEKIVLGFIVSLIIGYMLYSHFYNSNEINKNGIYGIGKMIDFGYCSGGSNCGEYEYFYKGKKYNSTFRSERNYLDKSNVEKRYKGKFYLIKYSNIKPNLSEIFLEKEIRDKFKIKKHGFELD